MLVATFSGGADAAFGGAEALARVAAGTETRDAVATDRMRVFFVGDAGKASRERRGLDVLRYVLDRTPDPTHTVVVFLGDNAYRQPSLQRKIDAWPDIDEQVRAAAAADRVFFIPGNHDWGDSPETGVAILTRERDYLRSTGGRSVRFVPAPGCPGPVRILDSAAVRLIALDSNWFLRDVSERRSLARERGCRAKTVAEVVPQLRAELECAADPCPVRVLLAHHPLRSGGGHAGYFAWRDHILCTGLLPMPGICSLVVAARKLGLSRQDMASRSYAEYVAAVEPILPAGSVVVSGHEHALQVIRHGDTLHLVSGAGSRTGGAGPIAGTEYVRAELGLVVGDFVAGRGATFRVMTVSRPAGEPDEDFRMEWPRRSTFGVSAD